STVAAGSEWAPYLFVHEFGHHFAALADEYYTSESVYGPATDRVEPWERNVTALKDPAQLKWKALLTPGTPLPTPSGKERYDAHPADVQRRRKPPRPPTRPEAEMDALFLEQKRDETAQFGKEKHTRAVGAFEGALYEPRGYYRPQLDCVMFSRNDVPF